jgi:hypothetical protein
LHTQKSLADVESEVVSVFVCDWSQDADAQSRRVVLYRQFSRCASLV